MGAMLIFVAVGYIALDTAFNLTGAFATSSSELKNIPLFVLYLIWPLFAVVTYVVLETALVLTTLGERKPLCEYELYSHNKFLDAVTMANIPNDY